jgi:hypothetical protein
MEGAHVMAAGGDTSRHRAEWIGLTDAETVRGGQTEGSSNGSRVGI